jgi:hypothetical protein
MKKNVGGLDSAIRVMLGLGLVLAAAGTMQWMVLSVALVVLSIPLFWTALTASCPFYALLGIDTTRADPKRPGGPGTHQKA